MTTCFLAPDPIQSTQFIPGGNTPANGGQIGFFLAGTSTPTTVYKDNAAGTPWTNPIVLDSGGNLPSGGEVWIPQGITVKAIFAPATDVFPFSSPYWTKDNLSGINDISNNTGAEWVAGAAPSFVSAASFRVSGDLRTTFDVGRRVRASVTAGTAYGTITSVAFATGSTTAGINTSNSLALDAGLSAISTAILAGTNPSVPVLLDNNVFMADATDRTKTLVYRMGNVSSQTQRNWRVQDKDIAVADINDDHGSCILRSTVSTITLFPWDGNKLIINGTSCAIADAGVTIGTTAALIEGGATTNDVVYYLYALSVIQGTVTHLQPSATIRTAQAGTGIQIRTGDPTATLVGMYMLSSTNPGQFIDSATTARYVRSWFNEPAIDISQAVTTNTLTVAGTVPTEAATYLRNKWLTWQLDTASIDISGAATDDNASAQIFVSVGVDSSTTPSDCGTLFAGPSTTIYPIAVHFNAPQLSEGLHYATMLFKTTVGGTAAIFQGNASATSSGRTTVKTYIHK